MTETPDVVLGQGALGTVFAALMGRQDRPVHVVSRRVDEPVETDLTLVGRRRRHTATVQLVPAVPDTARVVVVATRSDEALERARHAEPSLTEEGVLIPVQNGLTPIQLAEQLETSRVAPGVVGFNAHLTDPRTARITSPGDVTVGELHERGARGVRSFREATAGPITAHHTDNPRGAVWSKWCVSCAINGLAVVTGTGIGEITRERTGRAALVALVTECVDLAHAADVETERVAGPLKPDTLAGNATSGLGGAFRRGLVWLIGRRYRDVTPSSIDALEAGRDPEVDALNAQAVELGDEMGVSTPWNRGVAELAEEVVQGKREPAMANLDGLRQRARPG